MIQFIIMLFFGWIAAALALAVGLAFGLAGRQRAARVLDRFFSLAERPQRSSPPESGSEPSRWGFQTERFRAKGATGSPVGWTPRSGADRRRVARPGLDRRGYMVTMSSTT